MRLFRNPSIRHKQMSVIMLTTGVSLLVACAAFVGCEIFAFQNSLVQNLSTLAHMTGDSASAALVFGERKAAEDTLEALQAEPNIVAACIYTKNGEVFAKYTRAGSTNGFAPPKMEGNGHHFSRQRLILFQSFVSREGATGVVYLESDLTALYSSLNRYATIVAGVFVITLLAAFLLSARLQRVVSQPLLNLVQTARTVARDKDYSIRAEKKSSDEIGALIDSFNEMLAEIQRRDAVLQRAQADLEQRVNERTRELASSLSLVHSTLESTADGILVVDRIGKVINWNERFRTLWRIPHDALKQGEAKELFEPALEQLADPGHFLATMEGLHQYPKRESSDLLEFKDGRVFERCSKPQWMGTNCVGRVWSFRDITERKEAEKALRESQALYHSLVEQMPVGIFRKDKEGRFVFVNPTFCRLKGVAADQFLGKTAQEFAEVVLSERDAHKIELELTRRGAGHHEQIMESGRQVEVEEHYPHKDQFLHVLKSPVFDSDGGVIGSQGILLDITERKLAEAELARERDLLTTLLDNSPDYIYFKDLDSRFLRCSKSLAERFGLRPEELIRKTDFDLYTEEHARPAFEDEQEIIRSGRAVVGKIEREVWKKGEMMWVLTNKMPLRNEAGEIIGTFGLTKDITAIKEAEAKLDDAHRQLLDTSRMAGMAEVATSVLHNVGNVLNSVNVSCSLVADKVRKSRAANLSKVAALMQSHEADLPGFFANDPKGRQLPGYLSGLASHLAAEQAAMSQELLLLSANIDHIKEIVAMQQSYARVSGVREALSAAELVEDALRMNGAALERHQVKLVREYADVPPILVEKHKVLQILINLLRNAKYACDDSGRTDKQITVRISPNGHDHVRISVIDNGVGIPQENLTRIFEHGFTTRKQGHGFGLHSGALAAKELGGSLSVHSDGPGLGAGFMVEFPCEPVEVCV